MGRSPRLTPAWVVSLVVFALSGGCASASASAPRASAAAPASPAAAPALEEAPVTEYRLHRGDVLEVKFFYNPELNERLPIRPDGKISLALVGEVEAAGLSVSALQAELGVLYGESLRNPEVAVIVKELAPTKIYVGGEVRTAGVLYTADDLTLLQAIVQAGGFLRTAKRRNVVVLRDQGTPEPLFITVDLTGDLTGRALGSDLVLQPDDIVFVPRTRIARVDQFVDQYIRQVIPAALNLGVSYLHGDGSVGFASN